MTTPTRRGELTLEYMISVMRGMIEGQRIEWARWDTLMFQRCDVIPTGWDAYCYRIAPEPPAKRWRPWTPEEVPVGAGVRAKADPLSWGVLIVGRRYDFVYLGMQMPTHSRETREAMLERYVMMDGSPCGVEEET